MLVREQCLKVIADALAMLRTATEHRSTLGLFDLHRLQEDFYCGFLNRLYGLKLTNLNHHTKNISAIDLGDSSARLCYQITAQRTRQKVQRTLDFFIAAGRQKQYRHLRFLLLLRKQRSYHGLRIDKRIKFDPDKDILDVNDLLTSAKGSATPVLQSLVGLIDEELPKIVRYRRRHVGNTRTDIERQRLPNPGVWKAHYADSNETAKNVLLRILEKDLQKKGTFQGQFGLIRRPEESTKYNKALAKHIDAKPRMYRTGWPVFVLSACRKELKESLWMLDQVKDGISRILDDWWMPAVMAVGAKLPPTNRTAQIITYRHTFRAAHILLSIDPAHQMPRVVLGRMLDPSLKMQSADGAWYQCDRTVRNKDLWGSVYALAFIAKAIRSADALELRPEMVEKARLALTRSTEWIVRQWKSHHWRYDTVRPPENAPLVFCELHDAFADNLCHLHPPLEYFDSFLDSGFCPLPSYIKQVEDIGRLSAAVRLAYAFFLARKAYPDAEVKWRSLARYALAADGSSYDSVDAAMLLHMVIVGAPLAGGVMGSARNHCDQHARLQPVSSVCATR